MKKILSLALVLVMVMSLPIPVFGAKAFTNDEGVDVVSAPTTYGNGNSNGNSNGNVKVEKELPKGLEKKDVLPYGHRKDQTVTAEEMEDLIDEVLEYIERIDPDSDDDGTEETSLDVIDLEDAEDIALDEKDGSIIKMSYDQEDHEYSFEILYNGQLYEIEVDGVTEDLRVERDDESYDLDGIISYNKAKLIALARVDGMIIEVELDIEEADDEDDNDDRDDDDDDEYEDQDKEATYEVKILDGNKLYEIKIDALTGSFIDMDREENDDDENWDRDRDRDEAGDLVPAILNLINRIDYALEKDAPVLEHYYFQLESKYNILQKQYGERVKTEDYTEKLEILLEKLEYARNHIIYTEEAIEAIEDIIDDIEKLLEAEEGVSEEAYELYENQGDMYLDLLDEIFEKEDAKTLVEEVKVFVFENDIGAEIGDYSPKEALALLIVAFKYNRVDENELEDYYEDLKFAFKKFKMSKLVADNYLKALDEYKGDLKLLKDTDLTESEETSRDDLIELIETINDNKKMTLGTFYEIEEEALELLEEENITYEKELNDLIEEVEASFLASYRYLDQNALRNAKMTLAEEYFVALTNKRVAEDADDFEEILKDLQDAFDNFSEFLEA